MDSRKRFSSFETLSRKQSLIFFKFFSVIKNRDNQQQNNRLNDKSSH